MEGSLHSFHARRCEHEVKGHTPKRAGRPEHKWQCDGGREKTAKIMTHRLDISPSALPLDICCTVEVCAIPEICTRAPCPTILCALR